MAKQWPLLVPKASKTALLFNGVVIGDNASIHEAGVEAGSVLTLARAVDARAKPREEQQGAGMGEEEEERAGRRQRRTRTQCGYTSSG